MQDIPWLTFHQVVGEACGDRTPEIQRSNLFDMNAKYADIVPEAEAVEKLKAGWRSTLR